MDHTELENWQEDRNDPNWKHSAASEPVKKSKHKKVCMCLLDTDTLITMYAYMHKLECVHINIEDSGAFSTDLNLFQYQLFGFHFRLK